MTPRDRQALLLSEKGIAEIMSWWNTVWIIVKSTGQLRNGGNWSHEMISNALTWMGLSIVVSPSNLTDYTFIYSLILSVSTGLGTTWHCIDLMNVTEASIYHVNEWLKYQTVVTDSADDPKSSTHHPLWRKWNGHLSPIKLSGAQSLKERNALPHCTFTLIHRPSSLLNLYIFHVSLYKHIMAIVANS